MSRRHSSAKHRTETAPEASPPTSGRLHRASTPSAAAVVSLIRARAVPTRSGGLAQLETGIRSGPPSSIPSDHPCLSLRESRDNYLDTHRRNETLPMCSVRTQARSFEAARRCWAPTVSNRGHAAPRAMDSTETKSSARGSKTSAPASRRAGVSGFLWLSSDRAPITEPMSGFFSRQRCG